MAVDVSTEIVIARPRAEVAEFASDPERVPLWYANIHSVEWKTEPPVRVGSQIAFVARFLGRRLAYTYEVVELVPGERFVMRTAEGPFPMETTYTRRRALPRVPAACPSPRCKSRESPPGLRRHWWRCAAPRPEWRRPHRPSLPSTRR